MHTLFGSLIQICRDAGSNSDMKVCDSSSVLTVCLDSGVDSGDLTAAAS
jgi:hypothetical protein